MAKKKSDNTIFIVLALAAGGFYYYVSKKKKDEAEAAKKAAEEAEAEAKKALENKTTPTKKAAPVPTAAERAYTDAVRALQKALGIDPTTGFVGDKTKAALRALKLSDVVTAGNIADLILKVQAAKKAAGTPAAKPVVSLADQVRNAWNKSAGASLVFTDYVTTKPKLLDAVRNVWNDDPNKYAKAFRKGETISKKDGYAITATTTSNKVVVKNKSGEYFLFEPSKFIVQG